MRDNIYQIDSKNEEKKFIWNRTDDYNKIPNLAKHKNIVSAIQEPLSTCRKNSNNATVAFI